MPAIQTQIRVDVRKSANIPKKKKKKKKKTSPAAKKVVAGKGIFISYRRSDEASLAGRLYDKLSAQFGEGRVFMDVDSIELGKEFVKVLNRKT